MSYMKEPASRHSKGKFFRRFFIAFIFVFFLVIVLGIVREYFKRQELNREIANLAMEVKNLESKKADFLQSIELYQSDFFIEKEAREKFNLKSAGEQVSVIPVSDAAQAAAKALSGGETDSSSPSFGANVRGWWEYFFADKM